MLMEVHGVVTFSYEEKGKGPYVWKGLGGWYPEMHRSSKIYFKL